MEFKNFKSVHAMLQATVNRCRDRAAYRTIVDPTSGRIEAVTWGEFDADVRRVAKSLVHLGVEPGNKVCVLSYSCYRWALVDVAVQSIGSFTVGIYQSNLPKDCRYIINHSRRRAGLRPGRRPARQGAVRFGRRSRRSAR